jgi:lantibiotic biosynthesis protein
MRQIAQRQLDRVNGILASNISRNDSFLGGKLGLLFYYFHLYKVTEKPEFSIKGTELLENVLKNVNASPPQLIGPAFSSGGAGLGYVINFLKNEGFVDFDIDSEFRELDKYLFTTASYQIEGDFIDFLHGAMGVVHYFSERKNTAIVDFYLDELIQKICGKVVKKEAGYWFRNTTLKADDGEDINFGLPHGLSGILLILLNVYSKSDHKEAIKDIIQEGIRFIRKYKMDIDFSNDEYSFFPFIVRQEADEISAPNRLGWCYGDLNEVLLFYRAGKLFNDSQLIDLADVIGTQALMRKDTRSTLVADSNFCHGSSGLAQFYRKLHAERELSEYKHGYEYWTEQTILFLDKDLENGLYAAKEHELLNGLVGVAFSLLSYVSDYELEWSRALLL